jgi:hypothetical protein
MNPPKEIGLIPEGVVGLLEMKQPGFQFSPVGNTGLTQNSAHKLEKIVEKEKDEAPQSLRSTRTTEKLKKYAYQSMIPSYKTIFYRDKLVSG